MCLRISVVSTKKSIGPKRQKRFELNRLLMLAFISPVKSFAR